MVCFHQKKKSQDKLKGAEFLCGVNTAGTHMQMFARTYVHAKSDVPFLCCPLSGLSAAHLSVPNEFPV